MRSPKVVSNFDVTINGEGGKGKLGLTKVSLPSIKYKIQRVATGHGLTEAKVISGIEPLTCSMSFAEWHPRLYQWQTVSQEIPAAFLLKAVKQSNMADTEPIEYLMHGEIDAVEKDELSRDSVPMHKIEINVVRMAVRIGKEPALILDTQNGIFNLDGIKNIYKSVNNNLFGA